MSSIVDIKVNHLGKMANVAECQLDGYSSFDVKDQTMPSFCWASKSARMRRKASSLVQVLSPAGLI